MIDESTCWYQQDCVKEMNRFYDAHIKNGVHSHLSAFTALLELTDERGSEVLDLGAGTGMISEFCKNYHYRGADLPHIISGCAMRNYPQYMYKACDIAKDENIAWINKYPVVITNAVIDIMQNPIEILQKILRNCSKYLIIHRQEITENGATRVTKNPSYSGFTYHSIISRKDFNDLLEKENFYVVREIQLSFGNWENGGSSFLLRRRKSWALNEIDFKLDKHLGNRHNGFFIEAGANDGLAQSNTMFFEYYKQWMGILIEPVEELYKECKRNRSINTVSINSALVSPEQSGKEVEIAYAPESNGLMSIVYDKSERTERLMKRTLGQEVYYSNVKGTTLNYLLTQYKKTTDKIDLLVLDVEGYEIEVLKGLDFHIWNIEFVLIEIFEENFQTVSGIMNRYYDQVDKLDEHNYLYKRK